MTKAIINNLTRALATISLAPAKSLDLAHFRRETACGTLFCSAGHLTLDPHFSKLGMGLRFEKGRYYERFVVFDIKNPDADWWGFLNAIFGPDAFQNLFAEYGVGWRDEAILTEVSGFKKPEGDWLEDIQWGGWIKKPLTDQQLAMCRLTYQIDALKACRKASA